MRLKFFRNLFLIGLIFILTYCQQDKGFLGNTNKEFTNRNDIISNQVRDSNLENTTGKTTEKTTEKAIGQNVSIEIQSMENLNNATDKDKSKEIIIDNKLEITTLKNQNSKNSEKLDNLNIKNNILFILDDKSLNLNQNIVNSCFLTVKEFQSNLKVSFINAKDFLKINKHLLNDFDIIVGPLNENDEEISKIAQEIKIPYVSLNKKSTLRKKKIYFRPTFQQKYYSLFDFLKKNNKTDIAFLLPANQKANNFYENISKFKVSEELNIVNTEFYTENNKASLLKSLEKIKNNLNHSIIVDSSLKKIKINFKELNKEDKENLIKNNNEFLEAKNLKQITKQTDTIFIIANDADYEYILSYLNKEDLFNKNIFFITETKSIKYISNKEHFKNFFFTWSNPLLKEEFDARYYKTFNVFANEISYLIYDLLASIINWIEFNNKNEIFFANSNIFYGIYGDFKFDKHDIFRRFGIYKLDENLDFYLYYKSDDFL